MRTTTIQNKRPDVYDMRNSEPLKPMDDGDWPEMTPEELEEEQREYRSNAMEIQAEEAQTLMAKGYTVALGPIDWQCPVEAWISKLLGFEFPISISRTDANAKPRRLRLTLDLPGGRHDDWLQLTVETTIKKTLWDDGSDFDEVFHGASLKVFADGCYFLGKFENACCEMNGGIVSLRKCPDQEIADRVLAQLLSIDYSAADWPLPLYARLKPLNKCQACNRKLDDPVSRVLQLGPTCAKGLGLPHNQAIADAVNRLREVN